VPLLNINCFAASAQGTSICWNNQVVEIDAPCSGIRMLWAGLYLAATLASLRCLNLRRGLCFMTLSVVAALVANVLRVTSLFYLETGVIHLPDRYNAAVHEGVGVAVFFMLAIGLLLVANRLGRSQASSVEAEAEVIETIAPAKKSLQVTCLAICIVCALSSLVLEGSALNSRQTRASATVKWPDTFDGQILRPVPLSRAAAEFAQGFPGEIAVFNAGPNTVVYRHIDKPTRQLHPAADCYRAAGYQIKYLPLFTDSQGRRWETIEAYAESKDEAGADRVERLRIRERIFDDVGGSWTDVSAWYWSAVCGKSRGPWWSVAVSRTVE